MRRTSLILSSLFLGIQLAVLAAAPTAFAQTVKADYDKKTDFSKYKTFAFRKGTPAPPSFAQERIEAAIAAELKGRGMNPAETADLLIFTHTKVGKETRMD